jgi:Fuc2NAc and GlcNAc transferase
MRLFIIATVVAVVSWVLVGVLRRYATARGILDRPNARSSHSSPTPRGGGAGVVVAVIGGFLVAAPADALNWRVALALLAVVPTALVGWLDDRGSLRVSLRLSAHLLSALLLVPLAVGSDLSLLRTLLLASAWVIATISAINVLNFIDGIDGLVGLCAIVFGAHLALIGGVHTAGGTMGILLAAAATGFLFWNWAPAKIFLGDVGSGALAVIGVVGGVMVWRSSGWPFVTVFLPLFSIFLDALVTILRRAQLGERLYEPHRRHVYQRLAMEAGWGHAKVSVLYGAATAAGSASVLVAPEEYLTQACVLYAGAAIALGWRLDRSITRSVAERRPDGTAEP